MLQKFVKAFGGDPNKREIEKTTEIVELVNDLEADFEALSDDELRAKTNEFRLRMAEEVRGIDDPDECRQVEQEVLDESCRRLSPPCAKRPSGPSGSAITMCR